MSRRLGKLLTRIAAPAALMAALAVPMSSHAQATTTNNDHLVTPQAMQQQVQDSSAARQKNINVLNKLIESPTAQKAMHDAKVDPMQVKSAIPSLSDHDLANLSARATKAQNDFSAGYIGPGLFTVIVLAIILIIIVIVIH